MQQAIKLLALDVDGTLVVPGEQAVFNPAKRAVRNAYEQGVEVVIVTGRRYRTSAAVVADLDLPLDIVCLGGALVVDANGDVLQRNAIPVEVCENIISLARSRQLCVGSHQHHSQHSEVDFVLDEAIAWNPWVQRYYEQNRKHAQASTELKPLAHPSTLTLSFFAEKDELAQLLEEIEQRWPQLLHCTLVREPVSGCGYLEINLHGVNKWSALQRLAAQKNISAPNICAVGDDFNDLPMIKGAGFGVAMGSGNPQLAEHANWVTGAVDGDGIHNLVQRILG